MKNKFLKRTIASIISFAILISVLPTVTASQKVDWNDVKNYYPFSSWAVDVGLKYNLIFLENNSRATTRYEIASIIYNIMELKNNKTNKVTFKDIDNLEGNNKSIIEIVAGSEILKGYEDNTFKPYNNVTRAEFVTILDRSNVLYNNKKSMDVDFNDIDKHWAKYSIKKISSMGIVNGKGEGKFCPEETITPQEILIILDRILKSGVISEKQLISAMINTFKCKIYGEKEKFIIEEIYGNFEDIQNKVVYTWPYTEYYNPSNWQELSTYKDLQYAIFFSVTTESYIEEEGRFKDFYDNIVKAVYKSKDLEPNNQINGNKTFTLRDLINSIRHSVEYYTGFPFEETDDFSDTTERLNFTNTHEFSREDIISLNLLTLYMDDKRYYIKNDDFYLPLDAPVTNCMLNYFILNLRNVFEWNKYSLGNDKLEFETNPNKFPSNYYEYPYIVKGIPNYVYEKEVLYSGRKEGNFNAKDTYLIKFGKDTGEIAEKVTAYFNTMVNVDYTKNNFDEFRRNLYDNAVFIWDEEIDKYIEYVKNNQIILKGEAKAIPGTIVVYEPFAYIRVMMEFEIVSTKTNKNILFLDTDNIKGKDIIYEKNKYSFVVDVPIQGSLYNDQGEWKYGFYKAMRTVIYECLYPVNYEYIMR